MGVIARRLCDEAIADAYTWLLSTVWSTDYSIRLRGLENAKQALIKIGSATPDLNVEDLCDKGFMLV